LCRFIADEWPGELWDGFAAWKAARHAYCAAHPNSAIGDPVDMLRGERDARLRLTCPPG
jgi:hypothetical protein